jgi:hypothetical protein
MVKQLGSHKECGKRGCKKIPQWRVILGHWNVQAYSCSDHLAWTNRLDMITETTGTSWGWEVGHKENGYIVKRDARVDSTIDNIRRTDYARVPDIGNMYPNEKGEWS